VAASLLAGCGGSQPATATPGMMPQASATATHAARGKSWMLPEAKSQDLLYVADSATGVYVFTYPEGKQVGLIRVDVGGGLCSDKNGNVFVTDFSGQKVFEYAHGGSTLIATLNVDGGLPWDCTVDPVTGNLATVNNDEYRGSVSIFKKASGKPTTYTDAYAGLGPTCSYDGAGNLYVSAGNKSGGFLIAELPYRGSTFENVTVNGDFRGANFLQWDGSYIAVTNAYPKKPVIVSRVQVSGSTASVVGTVALHDSYAYVKYFWIQGNRLITPLNGGGPKGRKVGLWRYPDGGQPSTVIQLPKGKYSPGIALGITTSVAPSHSRK